ncbi:hypothetical protein ABVT39_001315 [Epinephelus coioides]
MEFQDNATAPEDFDSLHKTKVNLLSRNMALRIRSKNLSKEKEALQRRMNDLMGQDTQDTSRVSETMEMDEIDSEGQSTTPGDCESLRQANKFLIQNNKALYIKNYKMSRDIVALQKKINDLISQRAQVTSGEMSVSTEFADKHLQNQIPKMGNEDTQAEAVQSINELQECDVLEKTSVLEEQLQSFWEEQDLESKPLSLQRRFVRLFIPGWRKRYPSRETLVYVESVEQAKEETQRRPTLWQRFVSFCNQRFRRRRRA